MASTRPPHFWKHFFGMIFIGILNNVPYWVAISSAQSICTHFEKNGYIGAVTWGCVLLGIYATLFNAYLSSKNTSYLKRAIANGVIMLFGIIGTAFAPNIYFAILCISFVGVSSDFGEGVMLGYFAAVDDSSLLTAWGVGTGISGLIGAIYSFLCQYFKISYFYSFLCISWFGIAYPLIFYFGLDQKSKKAVVIIENDSELPDIEQPLNVNPSSEEQNNMQNKGKILIDNQGNPIVDSNDTLHKDIDEIPSSQVSSIEIENETSENLDKSKPSEEEKVPFCSGKLWCRAMPFIINNTLAFIFQYCCLEGLADCSMTQEQRINQPYLFSLLSICYQIGQLISKSSIKLVHTSKLWIFTLLNGIVFTFMMINTPLRFCPIWVLDIAMFLLGSFGGFSYMCIYDVMMKLDNTTAKEREIMTNYTSVTISGSIQIASGIILIFQNTFYKQYCKHT